MVWRRKLCDDTSCQNSNQVRELAQQHFAKRAIQRFCFWFSAEIVIKRRRAHEERERLVGWLERAHTSSERETDWRNEPQAIFGSVVLLQQYIALFNVIHFNDFIVFILHLLVCMCLIRLSSAQFTLVWACLMCVFANARAYLCFDSNLMISNAIQINVWADISESDS